eukprot:1735580-Pleurochrysis_carterae.AAC.1
MYRTYLSACDMMLARLGVGGLRPWHRHAAAATGCAPPECTRAPPTSPPGPLAGLGAPDRPAPALCPLSQQRLCAPHESVTNPAQPSRAAQSAAHAAVESTTKSVTLGLAPPRRLVDAYDWRPLFGTRVGQQKGKRHNAVEPVGRALVQASVGDATNPYRIHHIVPELR